VRTKFQEADWVWTLVSKTTPAPQEANARLLLLVGAVQELARARSLDEVVGALRFSARAVLNADGIAVVLRDGLCSHYVAEDASSKLWAGQRFPIEECISGLAMRDGKIIAIADVWRDERVPQQAYRSTFVRSMAVAPIGTPQATAALCAYWAHVGQVSEDAMRSLHALASAAATAIENGRLFEALSASERRFRGLFQASPVGIAIYDATTREVPDVNDAMLAIAGMTRHEFETGAWDFVRATAPEFCDRDQESREEILRTGFITPYEKAFLHRDGRRVPALMMAGPLDNEGSSTIVVAQDLSAIKSAEAALAKSETLLRGITERVGEVFYTYDVRDGEAAVAYISAAYEDIWGRARSSLVEAPMSFLDAVHVDDRPILEEAIARQHQGHETDIEYRIADPSGNPKWIHDRAYPVKDDLGRVVRIVGVAADITERQMAQKRAEVIAQEMDHRARNLMTIVRSIIGQTLRTHAVADEVTEILLGRMSALSAAHKAIMRNNWQHAAMPDLVSLALEPFRSRTSRITANGPDIALPPQLGLLLALALHELATNALKHGSLSKTAGKVDVSWTHAEREGAAVLRLTWIEAGGPPVGVPIATGFGTNLLREGLAWYGGETNLNFAAEGLKVAIRMPISAGQSAPQD
jgi:PAS domain S-box-containing protein